MAQWTNLPDYRPLIMPLAAIASVASLLLHEGRVELHEFLTADVAPLVLLPPTLGVLVVLLAVAWLRGSGGRTPGTGPPKAPPGGNRQ